MVMPIRFPRLWFAVGLLLSLGACALPRSGPDYSEITAAAPQDLQFDVVRVTPAVTAATRIDERSGFTVAFTEARVENTATVAPGDVMAITVWENIDQGLLNPQGIGATPLPHVKVDEKGFIFVPCGSIPNRRSPSSSPGIHPWT